MDRRDFLAGTTALIMAGPALAASAPDLRDRIRQIERRSGGRLGVSVLDTASGKRFDWHGEERFPLCSTFKFLLAGALLQHSDHGKLRLGQVLRVSPADLLPNSNFTQSRVGRGATVVELARAIMIDSDNAAANLLLPLIGGTEGLTRFARELGDEVTRLDRNEPALGEAKLGDPRDTTSPAAMVAVMERLLIGSSLGLASRRRLTAWLIACRTGEARLRAGLPAGWRIGDKTGTGANGTTNDIAIAWPPGKLSRPLLIAAYLTGASADGPLREAVLASVGQAVAAAHAQNGLTG
jgi:beta-lactamase class A